MRKLLLFLALACLPMCASAQGQHYLYSIVHFSGNLRNENFTVDLDDGQRIATMKDDMGRKLKFKTPAAVLTYFHSLGWELCADGLSASGFVTNGTGSSSTATYWLMRKPCTREELDRAVAKGIKQVF